jgi:putative DNA primase/helicase
MSVFAGGIIRTIIHKWIKLMNTTHIDSNTADFKKSERINDFNAARIQQIIAEVRALEHGTISQDGVARVFAAQHRHNLRFDHSAGVWFQWNGSRWARDETKMAFQFVRQMARHVTEGGNATEIRALRKVSFASGVERLAQSDPALAVTAAQWDTDPWLLGTQGGGTVDLRTGELRPSNPIDGITKLIAVAPADTADCPIWRRFLDETTGADAELMRLLCQWAGYSLTGITREHALLFCYGPGGNGKSVYLNTHIGIMADYAVAPDRACQCFMALGLWPRARLSKGAPGPRAASNS